MRRHVTVIAMLTLAFLMPCLGCRKPPDLSKCTQLEIQYPHGAMRYFFFPSFESIFDAEEREYIRSFDTWVVEDKDLIRAFAADVSQGTFDRLKDFKTSPGLKIACYRGHKRVVSLEVLDGRVITGGGRVFRYPQGLPDESILVPPGIQKFKPRWYCAISMRRLRFGSITPGLPDRPYPSPSRWCDAVVEDLWREKMSRGGEPLRRSYSDAAIAQRFRCPVVRQRRSETGNEISDKGDGSSSDQPAGSWVSDYAMNPDCELNSPPDTVLLFEAKPGWNQHGGPDLFTFDNHDPQGGCVLLNDGTVKFIRTKEELAALRWKP